jgi:hypothetical protein
MAIEPEHNPQATVDATMIGWPVYTVDGDHIGAVKEARAGYFKVDARLQPDYWLQAQFVQSNDNGRITMEFTKDELGDYKVHAPDEAPPRKAPGFAAAEHSGRYPENSAAETLSAAEHRDISP